MDFPIQITFDDLPGSDAVRERCEEEAAKLLRYADQIISCHVVIAKPHRHHHKGDRYEVRVRVVVPSGTVVVNNETTDHHADQDVFVAIRHVFDTARRQVEDLVRRKRRDVKTHLEMPTGRITKLFPQGGFGFIETSDGRELYFHGHSVLHDQYQALTIGDRVRFAEETGVKGPQASLISVIEKAVV